MRSGDASVFTGWCILLDMHIKLVIQLVGMGLIVLAAVAGFLWFVFSSSSDVDTTDSRHSVELTQYQAAARAYKSKLTDYTGLCQGIGVTNEFSCLATESAYRISIPAKNSGQLCIDSKGFFGKVTVVSALATTCK